MYSRAYVSALFVILAAPLGAQAQASDRLPAQVDSIAAEVLKSTGVPSASVAVVRNGKLAYAQAYGAAKLQPRVPARPEMRYGIGSVSKQFTAAALLLLQQEGKLSLDDPVSRWVPGLTQGDDVTLRMVLSHTSGYQDFWPQDYVPPLMEKPVTPRQILDHWAKQPLDFAPGTRWQYSNTNYVIAALAVEKASGTPFFEFVRTRLLTPLGIAERAVDFDTKGPGAIEPVGYMRYGLGPLRPATPTGPGWMWGAGELALTASDLAKWDISVIDQSLLAPASYQALENTVLLKSGVSSGYGLGVDVGTRSGHRMIEHSGEVAGFTSENMVFPDDSAAIVVLTNQDAAPAAGAIADAVSRALFTTEDAQTQQRTARARRIFEGLQKGTIDRSELTEDASAYFSAQALADFKASLGPLGRPTFTPRVQRSRGGMTMRAWTVTFAKGPTLDVWTYEMPDGKLEQYQVAPQG
ncbi:MAG: beta-lactamase family protein [Gemmatimonadaceae bacterium]|nr:beta-lactamase family protein [Gemmatimonadaceae bacterium]